MSWQASRSRDEPLAPHTTLELGGPAREVVLAEREAHVIEALRWATLVGLPAIVLGGGSNVVVADGGFPGLVVRMALRGIEVRRGESIRVTAGAGEVWDDLVAMAVDEGWGGIECLSGIPGTVGATPIQNVGAYGQEVSETIDSVRVLDRRTFAVNDMSPAECDLVYRDSVFRRTPERFVVLSVTYRLRAGATGTVRYPELAQRLGSGRQAPGPAAVRRAVLELRRAKSMVLDASDPNRRSVGSFFVNPIVAAATADGVRARALELGDAATADDVPAHPVGNGNVKLSAAWLVEHAGFPRGARRGPVGVSSRHALALVHLGGGTTTALIELAREIRDAVCRRFGVTLVPEPTFVGFPPGDPLALR